LLSPSPLPLRTFSLSSSLSPDLPFIQFTLSFVAMEREVALRRTLHRIPGSFFVSLSIALQHHIEREREREKGRSLSLSLSLPLARSLVIPAQPNFAFSEVHVGRKEATRSA